MSIVGGGRGIGGPGIAGWVWGGLLLAALVASLSWGLQRLRDDQAARAAFPIVSGVIRVAGPAAPIEVFRDARGIPHVEASSEEDAWFGAGFAHAQDRLVEMLWLRRQARGTTAEVVGERGLDADRMARLIDIGGLADAQVARLEPSARRLLEAYAAGVNARLARIGSGAVPAPPNLRAGDRAPTAWTPGDSLAIVKLWSWALSDSVRASLVLEDMVQQLGGVAARPFFPESPGVEGVPAPSEYRVADELPAETRIGALQDALGLAGSSIGSTAWVLGGAHTESGRPFLAADLHLPPTAPSLFYELHVRGGDLDASGATLPGAPVIWVGRNPDVAWAATHARAVVTDLFVETLRGELESGDGRYHDGKRWRPLWERTETLRVRTADDVVVEETMVVRGTRHGPLLNPLLAGERAPLALSWTGARRGDGVQSMMALSRARSAADVRAALSRHHEPVVAVAYADRDGEAGVQLAGWIPRRALPTGLQPVPGRARFYDWRKRVPYDELPAIELTDGHGWVVAADEERVGASNAAAAAKPKRSARSTRNKKKASQTPETPIEWLWRTGERAERLDALLRQAAMQGGVGLRDVADMQWDVRSPAALAFVGSLLEVAGDRDLIGPEAGEIADLLGDWNGEVAVGSRGAAAYHVLLEELTRSLFVDAMGQELFDRYRALPHADPTRVTREIVAAAARGGEPGGWSDPERVGVAVREGLRQTWFALSYRLGANRERWDWGRLHLLAFGAFPGLGSEPDSDSEPVRGPYPYAGDAHTVRHGEYDRTRPFRVRAASTYRMAADLGTPDQALSALAPGQSENPLHPNFDDGIEPWLQGRLSLLLTSPLVVEESSVARLTLEPEG